MLRASAFRGITRRDTKSDPYDEGIMSLESIYASNHDVTGQETSEKKGQLLSLRDIGSETLDFSSKKKYAFDVDTEGVNKLSKTKTENSDIITVASDNSNVSSEDISSDELVDSVTKVPRKVKRESMDLSKVVSNNNSPRASCSITNMISPRLRTESTIDTTNEDFNATNPLYSTDRLSILASSKKNSTKSHSENDSTFGNNLTIPAVTTPTNTATPSIAHGNADVVKTINGSTPSVKRTSLAELLCLDSIRRTPPPPPPPPTSAPTASIATTTAASVDSTPSITTPNSTSSGIVISKLTLVKNVDDSKPLLMINNDGDSSSNLRLSSRLAPIKEEKLKSAKANKNERDSVSAHQDVNSCSSKSNGNETKSLKANKNERDSISAHQDVNSRSVKVINDSISPRHGVTSSITVKPNDEILKAGQAYASDRQSYTQRPSQSNRGSRSTSEGQGSSKGKNHHHNSTSVNSGDGTSSSKRNNESSSSATGASSSKSSKPSKSTGSSSASTASVSSRSSNGGSVKRNSNNNHSVAHSSLNIPFLHLEGFGRISSTDRYSRGSRSSRSSRSSSRQELVNVPLTQRFNKELSPSITNSSKSVNIASTSSKSMQATAAAADTNTSTSSKSILSGTSSSNEESNTTSTRKSSFWSTTLLNPRPRLLSTSTSTSKPQ